VAVLVAWAAVLLVLAGVAPLAQAAVGMPFDLLALITLAPAAAALVVVVRPSWWPASWSPVTARAVATDSALALLAVAVFVAVLALSTGRRPDVGLDTAGAPVVLFLLLQAAGALGEEIGWRGVVQRCGEELARPWVVSAVAGFLFGATHLGYWSLGVGPVLVFAVAAMLMSLTITTLYRGSFAQRMVPATLVHLGVNLGVASLAPGDDPLGTSVHAVGAAAAMLAVTLALRSRRRV